MGCTAHNRSVTASPPYGGLASAKTLGEMSAKYVRNVILTV